MNSIHNYSKIYLDSVIDDENFLIINDEFANALDTLGLDHDKWKKVAKDFFYMGVINICSHYEVNNEIEVIAQIDPSIIRTNKEEADVTLENIVIKKMLAEKKSLIEEVDNNFIDSDGSFEKYIINILSED